MMLSSIINIFKNRSECAVIKKMVKNCIQITKTEYMEMIIADLVDNQMSAVTIPLTEGYVDIHELKNSSLIAIKQPEFNQYYKEL